MLGGIFHFPQNSYITFCKEKVKILIEQQIMRCLMKGFQYMSIFHKKDAGLILRIHCLTRWSIYSFIPESPRWLLSNGKKKEARKILTKLAERNGKKLSDEVLDLLETDKDASTGKIWQLFSTKTLTARTAVICFNWYSISIFVIYKITNSTR